MPEQTLKFKFTGTQEQRHTIAGKDVILVNGNEVELPVGNERVAQLIKTGILVPVLPSKLITTKSK